MAGEDAGTTTPGDEVNIPIGIYSGGWVSGICVDEIEGSYD